MKSLRINQVEEKQLMKKLAQLNVEETKNRMKYERLSTDLIFFLKQNRETTGYFAKTHTKNEKKKIQQRQNEIEQELDEYFSDEDTNSSIANNNNKKKLIRPLTANPQSMRIKSSNRRQSAPIENFQNEKNARISNGTSTPINSNRLTKDMRVVSPIETQEVSNYNLNKKKKQKFKQEIELELEEETESIEIDNNKLVKNIRPHTANPNLNIKASKISRYEEGLVTNHDDIKSKIKSSNSTMSSTPPLPSTPVKFIPSSKDLLFMKTVDSQPKLRRNEDTIKISTNNRYLVNNNKCFKGKYSFDFINNTKITINMSKNYIQKEKTRIMYENKVTENAEFLASLHKMQTVYDFKVKQFQATILT